MKSALKRKCTWLMTAHNFSHLGLNWFLFLEKMIGWVVGWWRCRYLYRLDPVTLHRNCDPWRDKGATPELLPNSTCIYCRPKEECPESIFDLDFLVHSIFEAKFEIPVTSKPRHYTLSNCIYFIARKLMLIFNNA